MKQAYREFAEFFRAAAQDLRAGVKGVRFPPCERYNPTEGRRSWT